MFSASKNSIKNEQLPVLAEQVYIHLTITLHWYYRLERAISIKQQYFLFRNYTTRFYLKRKHVPTTTTWARNNSLWAFAINCNRIYYKAEHRTWVEEKLSSIRFQLLVTTLIHYLQFCRLLLNLIWACEELQLTCSEYPHMCLRQHFCSSFNQHCRPKWTVASMTPSPSAGLQVERLLCASRCEVSSSAAWMLFITSYFLHSAI